MEFLLRSNKGKRKLTSSILDKKRLFFLNEIRLNEQYKINYGEGFLS